MLSTSPAGRRGGFTLIELMIGLAIIAIVLLLGLPSYHVWMQNTQIRNAAESIQNGIQRARAEAVRRNASVAFILDPSTTDTAWSVVVVSGSEILESRPASEGSANVSRSVQPGGATTITFGSLGTVVANVPASSSLTQVDVDSSALDETESRELRVTIGTGGQIRMCDPQLDSTGTDPRKC